MKLLPSWLIALWRLLLTFRCWTVIQHHQITHSRLTQQQKTYIGSIWLLYLEIFKWLSFSRCLSNVSWAIPRMVGVLPTNVGLISKFSRFLIGMGQSSSCLSVEPELTGPTNNFICRKRTSKSNWVLDQALDTFSCSFSCHQSHLVGIHSLFLCESGT